MAQYESWFKQDLKKPIKVQMLNGNLFSQDNQGNLIGVKVYDDDEPAALAGTVSANIIRADGGTVAATGTLDGNKCIVVLPGAAYSVPGIETIVVKLTSNGVVTTLLAVVVTIYRSSTETAVDPGTVMPSIQSLIQQINTAVASIPADYSSLWTSLAPAFSTDASYVAGQYVTNNGKVYRFNTAHAAGTWVASEVTEVKLGNEISDLNRAIINKLYISDFHEAISEQVTNNIFKPTGYANGYFSGISTFVESDSWGTTDYIPVEGNTSYVLSRKSSSGVAQKIYYSVQYDALRNPIKYVSDVFTPITTEENAAYIRIGINLATNITTWQFEKGSSATSFAPYSKVFEFNGFLSSGLQNYVVDCMKDTVSGNGYYTSSGAKIDSDSYHCIKTQKIPCKEGDVFKYKGHSGSQAISELFYDKKMSVIGYEQHDSTSDYVNITIPSGTVFVEFISFNTASADIVLDVYQVTPFVEKVIEYETRKLNAPSNEGTPGQVLKRTANGNEWGEITIPVQDVQPSQTTFFDRIPGKNKYNPAECNPQNNTWYDNSGAVISSVSTSAISGKIPIVSEQTYTFSAGGCRIRDYVLFNGDTFISKTNSNGATAVTFTAPENATYVGFNLFYGTGTHTDSEYTTAINTAMLELGLSATTYEPYTLHYVMPTNYLTDAEAVNAVKVTLEKRPGINLYDKTLAVDGKYFDSTTGNQVAASNFAISGLIPVLPNTQYCFSADPDHPIGTNYVFEFAQNGSFISTNRKGTQRAIPFITGSTTYYVGFNIIAGTSHTTEDFTAIVNALMLTYGACRPITYSSYEESYYSEPLNFKYAGKKWISCGTSITWYNSQQYRAGIHTGELCRGYNGLIADETGILLTNDGISGSTLTNVDSSSFINRYNTIDWTAYDIVTIEFAVNDNGHNAELGSTSAAANTTDFCGCLKTVIEYILEHNPTIILILCTDPDVRTLSPNTAGYNLKDYCDAVKTIADLYRLPVCDWYYRSGINPTTKGSTSVDYLTADGTHPNDKGHARMAKLLLQTMESIM